MATVISHVENSDGTTTTKKIVSVSNLPSSAKRKFRKRREFELNEIVSQKFPDYAMQRLEWYKIYKYGLYDFERDNELDDENASRCLNEYINVRANQEGSKMAVICEIIPKLIHGEENLPSDPDEAKKLVRKAYEETDLRDVEAFSQLLGVLKSEQLQIPYTNAVRIICNKSAEIATLLGLNESDRADYKPPIWYALWLLTALYSAFRENGTEILSYCLAIIMGWKLFKSISSPWRKGKSLCTDLMVYTPHPQLEPIYAMLQRADASGNSGCLPIAGYACAMLVLCLGFYTPDSSTSGYRATSDLERQRHSQQSATSTQIASQSAALPATAEENPREEATKTFTVFHENITNHKLPDAYTCFSTDMQSEISYDAWAAGFGNTVSSKPKDIAIAAETTEQVVLTYKLETVDNPGGTQTFNGTAIVIRTADGWKIDDVENNLIEPQKPSVPSPEAKPPAVTQKNKPQAENQMKALPEQNNAIRDRKHLAPEEVLDSFYEMVTAHEYQEAYKFFHSDYQNKLGYDKWASNIRTVTSAIPSDVAQHTESSDIVVLTYTLAVTDTSGETQFLPSRAVLWKTMYGWKIRAIKGNS